jgi:hypothetical protein
MNRDIMRRRQRIATDPQCGDRLYCTGLGPLWGELAAFEVVDVRPDRVVAELRTNRDDPEACDWRGEPVLPPALHFPLTDPGNGWWWWPRLVRRANMTAETPE